MRGAVVGIDLGTTNTVVGAVRDGHASALADADGQVLIPSVVSFHPSGSVLSGREAKDRRKIDPKSTIYSVKRLIGRSWDSEEVRQARHRFPFEMREGPGQAALVVARKETYTLPEISAFVLRKAKTLAEAALGTAVDRAVITVPANFNDLQRAATKVAGRVAGLEVMRILNEPTAAALAYGYGKSSSERLAVYDFGGGTLDITLLDLSDNVFEVLATAGDTFLGGDDIDHAIAERMVEALLRKHRVDAKADPIMFEALRAAAEDLKKQLSHAPSASVTVQEITHEAGGRALDFSFSLQRAELDGIIGPMLDKSFDVCREALAIAKLEPDAFSQVLLVGGSTRIPLVKDRVASFFKRAPVTNLNPDEVVAIGAAIQANALSGAERRKSSLPAPPSPAARATATARSARKRQSTLPLIQQRSRPPAALAGQGERARLPTSPGLQPSAAAPVPERQRIQPLVVPPLAGQPTSGIPVTEDRAGTPKRTTRIGLGGTQAHGQPPNPLGAKSPAGAERGATLKSASADAELARRLESRSAPSRDELGRRYGDLPLVMPPVEPDGVDLLDASELEELPADLLDSDDDEVTRGRQPAHADLSADFDDEPTRARHRISVAEQTDGAPLGAAALQPSAQVDGLGLPTPTVPPLSPAVPVAQPPLRATARQEPEPVIRQVPAHPPLLIDVTPLTLAVETVGGYCDTVIERNTPIPCEKSRQFATVLDNQDSVRVRVSQGEASVFGKNTLLGEVLLSGLRAAPRGSVKIDVNFALDASGMLNVNAVDVDTGRSVSTRIKLVGLSEAGEVESLRKRHASVSMG